jgi:hypothetical protein
MAMEAPTLAFIIDHRVRLVFAHWRSLLRGTALPDRHALDPAAIKAALPYVWICDEEADGRVRFCLRLAGEEVNRLFGESVRRRYIDRIFAPTVGDEVVEKFRSVLDDRALVWTIGPFFAAAPAGPSGECLVMPLRNGEARRAVLGITVPKSDIVEPPRRLYPLTQRREIVPVADLGRRPG